MDCILTDRQKEIYDYLNEFVEKTGYSPTISEIQGKFSLSSKASVAKHLAALEKRGAIRRLRYTRRGIQLKARPDEITVMIKGVVKAGQPVECYEDFEEIKVHPSMFRYSERVFALRVSGDSMIEAGILDGDLVFIEEKQTAENGQIVLASVDGAQTLKRIHYCDGCVKLCPENKCMKPLSIKKEQQLLIHGVLVGVWRSL